MPTGKIIPAFLLLAALAGCVSVEISTPEKTIQELTVLSDRWDKVIVAKQADAIAANMAEDFVQIRGNGEVVKREQFIRDITAADLTIDPYVVEDFGIRLYGDTALLTGRIRMTGVSEGQRFSSHFRYIDVYARRHGKWQVVSVQVTPIPKG